MIISDGTAFPECAVRPFFRESVDPDIRMTKISKILAVFVAVASLAFVGFAMATTFGGPNWRVIMQEEEFRGYRISQTPDGIWTAIRGSDEGQVASSKVLPDVLSKIMDEVQQQRQQRIQDLQARIQPLEQKISDLESFQYADEEALKKFEDEQRRLLAEIRQREADTAGRVIAATNESQKLENQIAARREDILRLAQEVEELRADQFRLREIRGQLNDLLNQLNGNLDRAEHREKLLREYSPSPQVSTGNESARRQTGNTN